MGMGGFSGSAYAISDPALCAELGPGLHEASMWYLAFYSDPDTNVAFLAWLINFHSGPRCSGSTGGSGISESSPILDGAWHQVGGLVDAPPGTESVSYTLEIWAACNLCFLVGAWFDDLSLESDTVEDPAASRSEDATQTGGRFSALLH
jgi:hypothetical protein